MGIKQFFKNVVNPTAYKKAGKFMYQHPKEAMALGFTGETGLKLMYNKKMDWKKGTLTKCKKKI